MAIVCPRGALLRVAIWFAVSTISHGQKFWNSSIVIDSPRAGEPAKISVLFAPYQDTLAAGTVIPLKLTDFTICNADCSRAVNVVGDHFASLAKWTENTSKLELTASSPLAGDRQVQVVIPLEEGMRLPRAGLDPFSRDFTLCDEATDCDINTIPAVGSFLHATIQTEIRYSQTPPLYAPSQAGQVSEVLTIRFWNNMRILSGEKVVVSLPDFTADQFSNYDVVDSNFEWSASWSSENYELNFLYVGSAPIEARLNVLTIQNLLAVASNGALKNDPNLLISTNARNGPVLPTAIRVSPFVTGLVLTSRIEFVKRECMFNGFQWVCVKSLAVAGDAAEIRVALSFSIPFVKNEVVDLHLPDVSGASRSDIPVTDGSNFGDDELGQTLSQAHPYGCTSEVRCSSLSYQGTGFFKTASWSEAARTLTFTASAALPRFTNLVLLVPQVAGVQIPEAGVRTNDSKFRLASSVVEGPIPDAPIKAVAPVGKIVDMSLKFAPDTPGALSALAFGFTARMALSPDDVLTLTLPHFHGEPSLTPLSFSAFRQASWRPERESLELTVGSAVAANAAVTVTVPVEAGVTLPRHGIARGLGASGVTFSIAAAAGSVSEARWEGVQEIPGLLDRTAVSLSAADGVGPTALNVSFTTSAEVLRGTVQVFLPGFPTPPRGTRPFAVESFSDNAGGRRALVPDTHFEVGSWNSSGPSLQFDVAKPIPAAARIVIHIPADVGLSLPALGSDGSAVAIMVRGVQDVPNIVQSSPVVAPAFEAVDLAFERPAAGFAAPMIISFTVSTAGGMVPGDSLTLKLDDWKTVGEADAPPFPGYDPAKDVVFRSQEPANGIAGATWTVTSNLLAMTAARSLAPGTRVQLVLDPASVGIRIPARGLRVMDSSVTFSALVGGMPVLASPVAYVQPVGALPQSPTLVFSNPTAGAVTAVTLTIVANMALEAGDIVVLNMTAFTGPYHEAISTSALGTLPTASWNQNTSLLVMTVGSPQPIPAMTALSVEVGAEWGLRIPIEGLSKGSGCVEAPHLACPITVTVQSDQFGSVLASSRTPVLDYTPIGKFLSSSLAAEPRVAGLPSALTVAFVYAQKITAGDELRVFLDEFQVADDLGEGAVVTDGVFGNMGWQVSRGGVLIRFIAQADAAPRSPQSIQIPQALQIRTPVLGVTQDNLASMTISIDAVEGEVLETSILSPPSIGAFTQLNVALDPASAGAVSELTFEIEASMDILQGEVVNLTLLGFTGLPQVVVVPNVEVLNASSGDYYSVPWFPVGQWRLDTEIITMTAAVDIPSRTPFRLVIPRDAGIAIPAGGLDTMFQAVQIGIAASNGWIDPFPVPLKPGVRPIAAVLRNTRLSVFPQLAGAVVEMTIRIQSRLKLNPRATVEILLPGFYDGLQCWVPSAPDEDIERRCLPQSDLTQEDLEYRFCDAIDPTINSFQQRHRGGCSFTPMVILGEHNDVAQATGACDCLESPADTAAQRVLWAATFPTRKPLPEDYGMRCGAWDNTPEAPCDELWAETGPHCCSSWCFVSPSCPTSIPWEVNNSIAFSYDTCADNVAAVRECAFNSPPGGQADIAKASWSPNGGRLVLTMERSIQAFTPFTVVVPASAGIRLPLRGLRLNQESLTVDLLDGLSRMPPSPIQQASAVGSFSQLRLSSSGSIVGRPTELTLTFEPSMPLRAGTNVFLVIPSFSSTRSSFGAFSTPSGVFSNTSWAEPTHTMGLTTLVDVPEDTLLSVRIPDGVVSIPPRGLRGGLSEGVILFTDALDGPVLQEFPARIEDVPVIGSLLDTTVHMAPQRSNVPLRITVDFTPQMEIRGGESVTLTFPSGFAGPNHFMRQMNPEVVEPADAFRVFWTYADAPVNGTATPASITMTALTLPVAAGTHCRVVIPQECAFLVDLRCATLEPIARTASDDYDPLALTLSSDASAGGVPPTPVRLSSVLAVSELGTLNGSWAGELHSSVAAIAEEAQSHLWTCLSVGYQCPSNSGYKCFSVALPATLDVSGDLARLEAAPKGELIADLNRAFQIGRLSAHFQISSFADHHLQLVNLTAPGFVPSCSYARPMHRVNLNGQHDVALELLMPFLFQATSSLQYHIRLRLGLSADPNFNPLGFEMKNARERAKLRTAIALTTEVLEEDVTFMHYLPAFQPIEQCDNILQCDVEIRIAANTEDQKQNGVIWSAKITQDIQDGVLKDRMWQQDLIASATMVEPIFSSPLWIPKTECPAVPQGRLSPVEDDWQSMRGDDVGHGAHGFASRASTTCTFRLGAVNGDEIDYDEAFTLDYEIIGLFVKQDGPANMSSFQSPEGSNAIQALLRRADNATRDPRLPRKSETSSPPDAPLRMPEWEFGAVFQALRQSSLRFHEGSMEAASSDASSGRIPLEGSPPDFVFPRRAATAAAAHRAVLSLGSLLVVSAVGGLLVLLSRR